MTLIHPSIEVWAVFRTKDPAPELPEFEGLAVIDHNVRKYHSDSQSEIRVRLHEAGVERVITALQRAGVRLSRHFLTPLYLPGFWDSPPEDCVGGLLAADGHVSLPNPALYRRLVPLSEPLYTNGRPEADSEHSREKPHVLRAGGIPIISEELLAILRKLGAKGETGQIIYRGFNKAAYDTVQPGYTRFLVSPEYEMPSSGGIEFLPQTVPADFGVCAMLRNRVGLQEGLADDQPNPADVRWYAIALTVPLCRELLRLRKRVLLHPIFCRGGVTHRWVSELEMVVEALKA